MNYRNQKRRRGVILTPGGLKKIEDMRSKTEVWQNHGARLTLEDLSALTGLAVDTIMKVFGGEERVDKHSLRQCFKAFNLVLVPEDYFYPHPELEELTADFCHSEHERVNFPAPENSDDLHDNVAIALDNGQVPLDSPLYIERQPLESRCYEVITESAALIRIKAPKQMGKTSLMVRILAKARTEGYHTVTLSLLLADKSIFFSLERFLQWFCACISQSLELPNRLEELWDEIYGSNYNVINYFEKYLLATIENPLVLALDDVDCVFHHPEIASSFFGLLRASHEKAKYGDSYSETWKKLRIIVVHSTEVYIPVNHNQSPFNVGLSIELSEFTDVQVLQLASKHQLNWDDNTAKLLIAQVGGHPMLIRQALYFISRNEVSLEELLDMSDFADFIYGDYLRHLLIHLQQNPDLLTAFRQVIRATSPVQIDPIAGFILQSLGLIHLQNTLATPSCQLYHNYFRDRL